MREILAGGADRLRFAPRVDNNRDPSEGQSTTEEYPMTAITDSTAWKALKEHHQAISGKHMRELFEEDPKRFERFSLQFGDILLDYSKNRVTDETLGLLRDQIGRAHV